MKKIIAITLMTFVIWTFIYSLFHAPFIRNPFWHGHWKDSEKEWLYQRDNWHHHYTQDKDGNWHVEYVEKCPDEAKRWHCGGKTYSDEDLVIKHESPQIEHEEPSLLDRIAAKQRKHELNDMVEALKNPK